MFEKNFSKDEKSERYSSNQKGHQICFVQVLEKVGCVSPKAAMSAMKTEKLRQLRAGKEERHAAFESSHNTLRNEMHKDSGFREPGNEGDERHQQRRAGG